MRVLHIFNELKYSGAEIMYANAASLFQQKGIEMIALSTGEKIGDFLHRFKDEAIEVHYMKLPINECNPFKLYSYFKLIYKFIKINKIDVLHIHRSKHFWFFSLTGYLAKVKIVRTVHNVFKHRKWTWNKGFLERYTASKIFNVTFQSIGKSVYENELNYYKNDSLIVNNWYDDKLFYVQISEEEKIKIRESLNISSSTFVVISTGGCSEVKNHHDIIRALKIVSETIDCTYLHLGEGVTTEEEQILAESLGISSIIHFVGNKNNVRNYLIASDVYLMPSRFEGLSIAAIEAMACGIPPIFYNVPGLKDLITNDDNGFLIPESYEEMAKKILILAKNKNVYIEKKNNAQKFVQENFSLAKGVDGIMRIYNS